VTGYAKIVADSISPDGVRLTTMEVKTHRFVLSEFNTHRVFSRNSASSRAIPAGKQIARILDDPAIPLSFPMEQKGMQGGLELDEESREMAEVIWRKGAKIAASFAQVMADLRVHKSVTNRMLEPYMWHTIVVTSTAWENFFEQRCSPLAQPEIRLTAEQMREAMRESTPQEKPEGTWHLPYIQEDEKYLGPDMIRVSAARCARVSYLTQDGVRDIDADLLLYERLVTAKPAHWSPLEHVATPWPDNRQEDCIHFPLEDGEHDRCLLTSHLPKVGNLLAWRSLRTEVEAEQRAVTFR
jgi:hypothetical protein